MEYYQRHARALAARYESIAFETAHAGVLPWLPEAAGCVLDVGAGSGRDAGWFAAKGHAVFAVEPASAMREQAAARHPSDRICWIDDRLPELAWVLEQPFTYEVVWCSAIWMHLAPVERPQALQRLLLRLLPGGRLFLSLRQGESGDGRTLYDVSVDEVQRLASAAGALSVAVIASEDALARDGVSWQHVVLEAVHHGSGAGEPS